MSNRRPGDTFERCPNCNAEGTCMYAGPCLTCAQNRARAGRTVETFRVVHGDLVPGRPAPRGARDHMYNHATGEIESTPALWCDPDVVDRERARQDADAGVERLRELTTAPIRGVPVDTLAGAESALCVSARVFDRDTCPSSAAALRLAAVRYVIAAMRAAGTPAGGVRPVEDLLRALEQAAPERG